MNNRITVIIVLLVVALLLIPGSGHADMRDRTGFFSNIKYHPESGDLSGIELYIAVIPKGYYTGALYLCEGGCSPVQAIKPMFNGDNITFEYMYEDDVKMIFKGVVDKNGVSGGFYLPGYDHVDELRLKRGESYWN